MLLKPQRLVYEGLVRSALLEDVGHGADLTTDAIVPGDAQITARIAARKAGIVAGLDASVFAFELLDRETTVEARIADGAAVAAGGEIARVRGSARAILPGAGVSQYPQAALMRASTPNAWSKMRRPSNTAITAKNFFAVSLLPPDIQP